MKAAVAAATSAQLNLDIHVEPLQASALVRDYYAAAPQLAPFFAGSPWDPNAWERVAADVRAYFDSSRLLAMSRAVRAGNDSARNKLGLIVGGEGFFVQTGQQAALFGGPLYTVHKILTTVRLARDLETLLQVPVAPLFWVPADDHDFAEVNHTWLLTNEHELVKLELGDDGQPPASMQHRLLGPDVERAVQQLETLLPDTEHAHELRSVLQTAYRADNTVAEAYCEFISFLFERFGLLLVSSADPELKRLSAPLFSHELRNAEAHEDKVNEQTQRLVRLGYHEQVPVRSDAANVSYEDEHGRDRLMRLGKDWELSRSKQVLSGAEIERLLKQEPQRFSANVLLRPVVASAVFPTLAYVGGPAEIAYFAQIGCLFSAHKVPMPVVVPRAGVEIVEYKVQKVLRKFGLDTHDVHVPLDQLVNRVVRAQVPAEITATFEQLRDQLTSGYGRLIEMATEIDPTLEGPLASARNASHKLLADMDRKIVRHLKRRNAIELEQLRRASNNLYPTGARQERILGVLTYYARYGPAILDAILEQIHFRFDRPSPDWMGVQCS